MLNGRELASGQDLTLGEISVNIPNIFLNQPFLPQILKPQQPHLLHPYFPDFFNVPNRSGSNLTDVFVVNLSVLIRRLPHSHPFLPFLLDFLLEILEHLPLVLRIVGDFAEFVRKRVAYIGFRDSLGHSIENIQKFLAHALYVTTIETDYGYFAFELTFGTLRTIELLGLEIISINSLRRMIIALDFPKTLLFFLFIFFKICIKFQLFLHMINCDVL